MAYKINIIEENNILVYYKIPFNYNILKSNNLDLFFDNKILFFSQEEEDIKDIYMIINEISEEFIQKFKIKKNLLSESDEAPNPEYLNILNQQNEFIDIDLKTILDFDKSEKNIIKKYIISRKEIKISLIKEYYISKKNKNYKQKRKKNNNINNENKEKDNYPEILFGGLKWENLKECISELEQLLKETKKENIILYKKEKEIINKENMLILKEKFINLENSLKKNKSSS